MQKQAFDYATVEDDYAGILDFCKNDPLPMF